MTQYERQRRRHIQFVTAFVLVLFLASGLFFTEPVRASRASSVPLVLGELPYQKVVAHSLTDKAQLLVNVANGNVILQTQDLHINGLGPALSIIRYFNDLGTGSGMVGSHDTLSIGPDVHVTQNADGSATYQGSSGFQVTYPSNGTGGYTTPASYTEATLAAVNSGGWTLTFHKTSEVYTFNGAGNQVKDASANGEAINYAYNTNGTLASATDTQGRVTTFTNYSGTNVGTITDPNGRTVRYTYTNGQLTGVTDAMNNTWQFQYYDTRGNLNQIVDPRGYTTTLTYNASNRIALIKYNDYTTAATTWTYTYNSGNTIITDPLNHQTTYAYDASGRVTSIVDGVGASHGATWDGNNNQTASIDPSSYATTLAYDSLNNLTSTQNPSLANGTPGAKQTYVYGNTVHPYSPSSSTDSQGNLISYSYDTNGNLLSASSTGAGSTTQTIQGDSNVSGGTINCGAQPGEVCTSTDANKNVTSYGYDSLGNVVTVTHPGSVGKDTYTYDNLSRIQTHTDGNGSTGTFSYDNFDRLIKMAYAKDGSVVDYSYDQDGNMTQRDDGSGQTLWTYDGYNRVKQLRQTNQSALNYTYDNAGNLITEQGPAGILTYSYDNANQIAGVNQSVDGANETFVFTNGRPTTVYVPGNITETISYDRAGRQISIQAVRGNTTLISYSATYTNSLGADMQLIQSETNNLTGVTTNYSYDGLNRLTSASGTGTGTNSYTYAYDNNGNRTQFSHNGSYSAIFGYNTANELTTAGGAADGTYDQQGNQTSLGTGLSFGYNPKNQTTSFTPQGGATSNANYLDADQADRTQIGGTSEQNGLLGLYSDTSNGTSTYYTHLPSGIKQVLGEVIGTTPYYYLTDIHGSVVAVVDGSGNVANTYKYDPYGNTLSSTGSIANPFRYESGYYDGQTGLYKFGERYYNAVDARWTQLDPSGKNPGYIYAGDDPVNLIDPSGTDFTGCLAAGLSYTGSLASFAAAGISYFSSAIDGPAGVALGLGFGGAGLAALGAGISHTKACSS